MPLPRTTTAAAATTGPDLVDTDPLIADAAVNGGSNPTAEGRAEAEKALVAAESTGSSEGLGSLQLSLLVSMSVRGFALATWRGAANRDGFVMDIDG